MARAATIAMVFVGCLLAFPLVMSPKEAGAAVGIQVSAIPGLAPPQAIMGAGVEYFCPRLGQFSLDAAGQDLRIQCNAILTATTTNGLGTVLGSLSQQQAHAYGSNAVEGAPNQSRIGARLAALRRGVGSRITIGGRELDLDGKELATAQPLLRNQTGGGASADQAAPGRLGLWLNGNGSFGDHDGTPNELGYSYHTAGLTAGADYRLTDNLVLGAAFNYLRTNTSFDANLGSASSNGYGGLLYGTYYVGAFHIDLNGGFMWNTYGTTRNINYAITSVILGPVAVGRSASGSPDGQEYNINLAAGYDFAVSGFTLTPYARVEYLNSVTQSYTESGALGLNLVIQGQRVQSLLSVLGGQASYAFSVPFGVLSPYVRAEWRHEYMNGPQPVTARYVADPTLTNIVIPTDSPTRNYANVGAGASAQFAKGISAFISFDAIVGLSNFTNYQFVGGLRAELL